MSVGNAVRRGVGGGRSGARFAGVVALLFGALAAAPGQAAELVSNLGRTGVVDSPDALEFVQPFTTGDASAGYLLTGVRVRNSRAGVTYTASIWTVDGSGLPDTAVVALTAPASFAADVDAFTAPANTVLAAKTTYAVRLSKAAGYGQTAAVAEDAGAAPGWSLGDESFSRFGSDPWLGDRPRRIAIDGEPRIDPTVAPVISGTAQARQTLTTSSSALLTDPDGLTGATSASFRYQWVRIDGATRTDISGATTSAYTLTDDDVGKRVRVRVSFEDDDRNLETRVSAAFPEGTVAAASPAFRASSDLLTATLTAQDLTGALGCENTSPGNFCSDTTVLTEDQFTHQGTDYTVTGLSLGNTGALSLVSSPRPTTSQRASLLFLLTEGGDTTTLAFADGADRGTSSIRWFNTGLSWAANDSVTVVIRDPGTGDVTPPALANNPLTLAANGLSLQARFDEALDGDNLPPASAFWVLADGAPVAVTAVALDESNPAAVTLTLGRAVAADQAVLLSYTDPSSANDTNALQDAAGNDVATFGNIGVAPAPRIRGTAQAGATLTALTDGLTGATYTYQWVRVDGTEETNIASAEASTYELTADDVGKRVRVVVSFTDDDSNAETRTSPPFPAVGTVRATPADGDLLSATLTAQALGTSVGCDNEQSGNTKDCSNASVLTDDDFTLGTVTPAIYQLSTSSSGVLLALSPGLANAEQEARLSLVLDGTSLAFEDGRFRAFSGYSWTTTSFSSVAAGDTVSVTITEDRTPPALATTAPSVAADGVTLTIPFTEDLDDNLAPASALSVTADGRAVAVTAVAIDDTDADTVLLTLTHAVGAGQTVRLGYTDPTAADDANALQDAGGNDVTSFADVAVTNNSTQVAKPGAPTGLTATANGGTRIDLAWTAPAVTGITAITGYRIEWSADGTSDWTVLVANTGVTTSYADTGLASETTRHYRVAAVNSFGAGAFSDSANATTDDIVAPLPVAAFATSAAVGVRFDEALDDTTAGAPPTSAFAVTLDGVALEVAAASVMGVQDFSPDPDVADTVALSFAGDVIIHTGQVVRVAYTDPSAGDDAQAIQDDSGNDAASFRVGPDAGDLFAVENISNLAPTAPGRVVDLRANAESQTTIRLDWSAPTRDGGRAVTGYHVVGCDTDCNSGTAIWTQLATLAGVDTTTWRDTTLSADTTRHYRVFAVNSVGRSTSAIVSATTQEAIGGLALSLAPDPVQEGESLTWTVTATTRADRAPPSDLALRVRVATADVEGGAVAGEDYTPADVAAAFAASDFARRDVDGKLRYVATKTGPIATALDVAAEPDEPFAVEASIVSGGAGWTLDDAEATASIRSLDRWGFALAADVARIAEGQTADVTVTLTSLPNVSGCVLPFPVAVSFAPAAAAASERAATFDTAGDGSGDYRYEPAAPPPVLVPACTDADASWTVRLGAYFDTVADDGETIRLRPEVSAEDAAKLTAIASVATHGEDTIALVEQPAVAHDAPATLELAEADQATYGVWLATQPTGTVTVAVS
ncbi:MAG: SwmB domain-containing protein, partial [Gammaproteobacteria bacterium]|nr:SwmB domain-containing protein [Gammaproteobacteria bacterium]